ncbi:unnamed protein product, partial [Didymodactylos carnosus]
MDMDKSNFTDTNCCVYVGNILCITDDELLKYCMRYGTVVQSKKIFDDFRIIEFANRTTTDNFLSIRCHRINDNNLDVKSYDKAYLYLEKMYREQQTTTNNNNTKTDNTDEEYIPSWGSPERGIKDKDYDDEIIRTTSPIRSVDNHLSRHHTDEQILTSRPITVSNFQHKNTLIIIDPTFQNIIDNEMKRIELKYEQELQTLKNDYEIKFEQNQLFIDEKICE